MNEQEAILNGIMHKSVNHQPPIVAGLDSDPGMQLTKEQCIEELIQFFPGICPTHMSNLYDTVSAQKDFLALHILENSPYPTAKDVEKQPKRKREVDEDDEMARKYSREARNVGPWYYVRDILSKEFVDIPMAFIDACIAQSHGALFAAYRILEEARRMFNPANPAYRKLQKPRKGGMDYSDAAIARQLGLRSGGCKRRAEREVELDDEKNLAYAKSTGQMLECGCCCDDYPINRMVHCNAEDCHWFCKGCALNLAQTEIGQSRYVLTCMSTDVCQAGFSLDQRAIFLDEKTVVALERIHQESELRLAGIENLASCPFCTYAAEYPPIEENRVFRCQMPGCEKVTCRLCNLESHIPKSCEENAKHNDLSVRRQIEEAMSEALIRRCNKCKTPFVKAEGCNKMTCSTPACSESCGYDHFNDTRRGGKEGNCPLFD
ncbi:ring finger protein [Calycina marina]|uniref:Ring finger protein n=1 Tax=Calycina marina TaxID=1763456 RepID=A0A9P7Z6J5_9HELO|nr:ring finger protein [Calycina marina]